MNHFVRNAISHLLWQASVLPPLRDATSAQGIRIARDWYGDARSGTVQHTGRCFRMGNLGNELSCRSYWYKSFYEPHPMRCLHALDDCIDTFVDVGANVGLYALFLAAGGRKKDIYAFDPHPDIHRMLTHNVELNGFSITVEDMALSETVGEATMHFTGSVTSASLEAAFNSEVTSERRMRTESLDHYFLDGQRLSASPVPGQTFIKMDILGHESAALRGAKRLTEQVLPTYLLEAVKPYDADVLDMLRGNGYDFFLFTPGGIKPIDGPCYEKVDGLFYANFLAIGADAIRDRVVALDAAVFAGIDPEASSLGDFVPPTEPGSEGVAVLRDKRPGTAVEF